MKKILLYASISVSAGLLFTNIYNSMVDAVSWGADIPHSIETARQYFHSVNPGLFFRIFSPVNQVLSLLALITFWKSSPKARLFLVLAFVFYVGCDIFTFGYFYPRNSIMFGSDSTANVETLRTAFLEWSKMNWLRTFMVFCGLVFSFSALNQIMVNTNKTI